MAFNITCTVTVLSFQSRLSNANAARKEAQAEKLQASKESQMLQDSIDEKKKEMKSFIKPNTLDKTNPPSMVPPATQRRFQEYECPHNLVEVEAKIKRFAEEMASVPKYTDLEKREAREAEAKLKAATQEIEDLELAIVDGGERVKRLDQELAAEVDGMVRSIDVKFSSMMATLGNSGSVVLEGAGNNNNGDEASESQPLSNYGLNIMVQFGKKGGKGGASLQRLSTGVQSGGEKSVTTAVYMMALQELTEVPFRCVDEINQGESDRKSVV